MALQEQSFGLDETITVMDETLKEEYSVLFETIINAYIWSNIIYAFVAILLISAFWLIILRNFNNKSINAKLDTQNDLMFKILTELKKSDQKENPKTIKEVTDIDSETSLNDPEVLQNLIDKLEDKKAD